MNLVVPKIIVCFLIITTFCNCLFAQHPSLEDREWLFVSQWKFKKGIIYNAQNKEFNDSSWEAVNIPHTYSMDAINAIGYYRGMAWYRTSLLVPSSMANKRVFIRFEGVGQEAEVFVNGQSVGKHVGGYSAFCFEITKAALVGEENAITVKVSNAPDYKRIPVNDNLFNHYGGIYRPVQLFATAKTNIKPNYFGTSGAFITLKDHNVDKANIEIKTHISSTINNKGTLSIKLKDKLDKIVATKKIALARIPKDTVISTTLTISAPQYWQARKNPYLYNAEIKIVDGQSKDHIEQSFGLKSFEIDPEKGFVLNDSPYRLYGVCMHQEWKQVGPALTNEHHKRDMDLIDEIGATAVRFSHYQHSDITYQLADEKGLLVWAEIPFVHDYSGREGENAKQQLKELILQNYNHPSIYTWGLWNEVRAYNSIDEPCVPLTKELNKLAHELDPTRVTTSASDRGMESNMGNISDLQSWNKYYGWYYGEYQDMGTWLDEYHQKYPKRAVGISEYGIGGNIFQQDISKLEKPSGNYFPEPEQTKYHEITWSIIKKRPFVLSSYIWNMFDFSVAGWNRGGVSNLNHKGLVSFDRSFKKDAFYFYKANWSSEPTIHIVGKRNDKLKGTIQNIKVYSNTPSLILWANGQKIVCKNCTSENMIAEFKDVLLKRGKNTIKVTDIDEKIMDKCILTITE